MIKIKSIINRFQIIVAAIYANNNNLVKKIENLQNTNVHGWANFYDFFQKSRKTQKKLNQYSLSKCRSKKFPLSSEIDVVKLLYCLTKDKKIKNVIEVGIYQGACSYAFAQAIHENKGGFLYLVDKEMTFIKGIRKNVTNNFPLVKLIELKIDSAQINKYLKKIKSDLIFLDADHSYKAVIEDIKNFYPYLKPGGYFVMHDSIMWKGVQVAQNEFFKKQKIITLGTSSGSGISLIKKLN